MRSWSLIRALMTCLAFAGTSLLAAQQDGLQTIQVQPDLAEFMVGFNQDSNAYRARLHRYEIYVAADPIVNGRIGLGFDLKLNERFTLDFFVASENYRFGQFVLQYAQPHPLANTLLQFEVFGGMGLKIRLSEWIFKSVFFLEPTLSIGYYTQEYLYLDRDSVRIRPGLYLGMTTVLDWGLMLAFKTGIEYPFDIPLHGSILVPGIFTVVPLISAGYAW